ncbi:hypothetical protein ATK17_3197 [Branchiibius hedensis]|uniref:Uncharacterized protein n=1 Tax=Branchiibius hedensis TaxID=672460 RepID=A0A2Y9C2B8_9MICO|nr:hypothetical protein [Branchiibius hedensis]PWJ27012.1 hypothetical protein ATK17_3197 [Branchiibius hedensis]SSA35823.1 hypothetical protein SAMN04489750_3197 [Branchiibius hedensis]
MSGPLHDLIERLVDATGRRNLQVNMAGQEWQDVVFRRINHQHLDPLTVADRRYFQALNELDAALEQARRQLESYDNEEWR